MSGLPVTSNSVTAARNLLRDRAADAPAEVTQIELFCDLVFVFAVTQLSASLRTQPSQLGLLHTAILFAATWWVWAFTAWATNWLEPAARPVRVALIGLMFLGLIMATSIPGAFGARGYGFAGAYVAMQLGRNGFLLWSLHRHDAANFRNVQRMTAWFAVSALFWLAGAALPEAARTAAWAAALAVECAAPAARFYVPGFGRSDFADIDVDAAHLAERCAGFVLIALGESITVIGGTVFVLPWTWPNFLSAAAIFAGIVALWWIYFDKAAARSAAAFAKSEKGHRSALASSAYTYMHGILVAGIVVTAAGDGLLLASARPAAAAAAAVIGGPALFLLGSGGFRRLLARKFPPSHLAGLAGLAVVALVWQALPVAGLAAAVAAVLAGTIIYADILLARQQRR